MNKFDHIKKRFKTDNSSPEGGEYIKTWLIMIGTQVWWLNDRDGDGKFIKINSYSELKKKIQNKLKLIGFSDVTEIPQDIKIKVV